MTGIHHRIKQCNMNIVKNYIDYRLSKKTMEELVNNSLEELRILLHLDPANQLYPLMTAHLYIISNKRDSGRHILGVYERCEGEIMDADPFIYSYYIYLKYFVLNDKIQQYNGIFIVGRVAERLSKDWRAQWIRLQLDEIFGRDLHLKMSIMEKTFANGCISPVMYYELCTFLNDNPTMLKRFDYTLQGLLWGVKHDLLNQGLMSHILSIAQTQTRYMSSLYKLLAKIYTVNKNRETLKVICHQLILGRRKDSDAHGWYQKGLQEQVRINGIHEYYLTSIDRDCRDELPQSVVHYFVYNTNIDRESREYLYANLIHNQSQQLDLYQKAIVSFGEESLASRRNNGFLAKIYSYILRIIFTNNNDNKPESRAFFQKLLDVTFQHKITIRNEKIKYILLIRQDLGLEEKVLVNDGVAYIDVYSPYYYIYFVDKDDNMYSRGIDFTKSSVLSDISYVEDFYTKGICNERSLLYLVINRLQQGGPISPKTLELVADAVSIKDLNDEVRSMLAYRALGEYEDMNSRNINLTLLSSICLEHLDLNDVLVVVEHYVNNGLVEKAAEAIEKYGHQYFSTDGMNYLADLMLQQNIYNKTMVSICEKLFLKDAYDKRTIAYLVKYYSGPLHNLLKLWKKAKDFGYVTTSLEEKAIEEMIVTETVTEDGMLLIEQYEKENLNSSYLANVLNYLAYSYLLGTDVISSKGIDLMKAALVRSANNLYEYVIIRYYSKSNSLTQSEKDWVEEMANIHSKQKRLVSWYKKFSDELKIPKEVQERNYVEQLADPDAHLTICYYYNNDKEVKKQVMKQVAEGLFVGCIVAFHDETVKYYVEETIDDTTKIVQKERFLIRDSKDVIYTTKNSSYYDKINAMIYAKKNNDDESLDNLMDEFIETEVNMSCYFKPM